MKIGIFFVFKGESSIGDVVEVLQPLKVGNGDTTGVDVKIRDDENRFGQENFVCGRRSRSVGAFGDNLVDE